MLLFKNFLFQLCIDFFLLDCNIVMLQNYVHNCYCNMSYEYTQQHYLSSSNTNYIDTTIIVYSSVFRHELYCMFITILLLFYNNNNNFIN